MSDKSLWPSGRFEASIAFDWPIFALPFCESGMRDAGETGLFFTDSAVHRLPHSINYGMPTNNPGWPFSRDGIECKTPYKNTAREFGPWFQLHRDIAGIESLF
jgi:hypothetical protein